MFVITLLITGVLSIVLFSQAAPEKGKQGAVVDKNNSATANPSEKKGFKESQVFEALALFFLCGLSAGYLLGKARSPKFDDPTESPQAIRKYVIEKCHVVSPSYVTTVFSVTDCIVGRWDDGAIFSIGPFATYYFSCGVVTYIYNAESKELRKRPFKPIEDTDQSRAPRQGFKFGETLALLVGGAGGYSLKEVGSQVLESADAIKESHDTLKMIFYGLFGVLSGLLLGFWLAYVKDPKCGEPLFQQLLNDVVFWEGVAEREWKSKWWYFCRTKEGVHVLTGNGPLPQVRPSFAKSTTSAIVPDLDLENFRLSRVVQKRFGDRTFEEPDRAVVAVLQILGEDQLVAELKKQAGKDAGWFGARNTLTS